MEPVSRKARPWIVVLVVLGAVVLFASTEVDGFVGGMGQGAGFAIAVLGAYFLGMVQGQGSEPETWLPSRDGRR